MNNKMSCKLFRRDLPDWLRGNVTIESGVMEAHAADCRECAREEALERHLRGAWKSMPAPDRTPEVWPRIAAALDGHSPRITLRPARLALGSAFALGAICAVLYTNMSSPVSPGVRGPDVVGAPVNERRGVEMVQELRRIPDLDSERLAMEPPHLVHEALFLGAGERK